MTFNEIIAELAMKYPHSLSNSQVAGRMDRVQKRIFRQLNTAKVYTTTTTANTESYGNGSWPKYARQYRKITIDDIEYDFWDQQSDKPDRYWYLNQTDYQIYVYPIPTVSGLTIKLLTNTVPTTISTDPNAIPDLQPDFHMLLVYGVAKEIAEDMRDGSMATAFAVAFNDLYNDMMQAYQNPVSYVVREIPWG